MAGMERDLPAVAALIADPSRAAMLDALLGGTPLAAGELARRAGVEVARALEALAAIAPERRTTTLRAWRHGEALRTARSCYDHLAGRAGVGLADALVAQGVLRPGDGGFAITPRGADRLGELGLDVGAVLAARRATARACVDWSERRPHVAGALGAALLDELLRRRWVQRRPEGRALRITPAGEEGLAGLGVRLP
ncbi:MAG: helix-turn-helix transcriptional regulator [Solirubrobacterales bacterium]|nr:helix-turn-helix transcriptional regulator [Solirubrobacterales bacterium]